MSPPGNRSLRVRGAILVMVVLGLPSCSLSTQEPVTVPHPRRMGVLDLPAVPGYPGTLAAVQSIHVARGDRGGDVQAVLEVSAERLALVVSLPFGPRLADILWSADGVVVRRGAGLPPGAEAVQPEDVLADIVLAYWPEANVRASLRPGLSLAVAHDRRMVTQNGAVLIDIQRQDADPWNGVTRLDNRSYGYRLTIESQAEPGS